MQDKTNNITLAILAGGKASRMGGINKALIQIEGQLIIHRIYNRLSKLFTKTIIISNSPESFGLPNLERYADIIKNTGPLGGIHSALVNSENAYVFIVSCDMPFVDANIAKKLVELAEEKSYEIIIPKIGSFIEPLFAIYSKQVIHKIENIISSDIGRPITDLIKVSSTGYLTLDETTENKFHFTNINTIEDIEGITKR